MSIEVNVIIPPIEIEVSERLGDYWIDYQNGGVQRPKYHVQPKGGGPWACGRTRDEAIGQLVRYNPELFNVTISELGRLPR